MRLLSGLLMVAALAAAAEPARPKITTLAEVTYKTSDLEKARAFYHGYLGLFGRERRYQVNVEQTVILVPGLDAADDRFVSLTLRTSDVAAMARYLKSTGVAFEHEGQRLRVRDPEGHSILFAGPEPALRIYFETPWPRMIHAGILTGSLGRALEFYREVLGFKEIWRGSRDGRTLNWVNLRVPDGGDYLELMLYKDKPAGDQRGSAHHICLVTESVLNAIEQLKGKTGYSRPVEPRTGTNRKRQANLFDPDGTRVELMEPRTVDGTPAPPATAPPPIP